MPPGDKRKYTGKQIRQAAHIEAVYEKHGLPVTEARERTWRTVNKTRGGG
jgi:hypothetical protein